MDKWLEFYNPHFKSQNETKKFVDSCEKQAYPNNVAKILMHQVQRLISLSGDIQKIRPNDEPLQLLFLIMCVENVAKLHDGYTSEYKSKHYVKKFFNDFLSDVDKDFLRNGFIDNDDVWLRPLNFERVIEMLYKIRCDVIHEGNYTDFGFYDGNIKLSNSNPNVIAKVTLQNVRDIIIRGCIKAIQSKL
jgi:hypothetical protein